MATATATAPAIVILYMYTLYSIVHETPSATVWQVFASSLKHT